MRALLTSALLALPFLLSGPAHAAPDCEGGVGGCKVDAHQKAEAGEAVSRADVLGALLDALDKDPEGRKLLAKAVMRSLRENQQAEKAAALDHALHDEAAPYIGNKDGKVVIVEYFDDRCPFCKALTPVLARTVAENPDVKLVFKEFAILGPQSEAIARAALAAQKQGKFVGFHDELMRDPTPEKDPFTVAHIFAVAEKAGLSIPTLKADMDSPAIAARMTELTNEGRQIGVTSTPGLVIDGKVISVSARPTPDQSKAGKLIDEDKSYDNLKAAITAARQNGNGS